MDLEKTQACDKIERVVKWALRKKSKEVWKEQFLPQDPKSLI